MKYFVLIVAAFLMTANASAQTVQPYTGLQDRPIKALSDQQIADLRAGRGMGLALSAELNGYPGPSHVLELGDRLNLSAAQREQAQKLFASMKSEAVPLGETVIAREQQLDRLFASRAVTPQNLAAATQAIGQAQAALRATHLKYHLSTAEILNADQMREYAQLRGYSGPAPHQHRQH